MTIPDLDSTSRQTLSRVIYAVSRGGQGRMLTGPDGRLENGLVPHAYTAETIRVFADVRAQGGYALPSNLNQRGRMGVHGGADWHADWMEE